MPKIQNLSVSVAVEDLLRAAGRDRPRPPMRLAAEKAVQSLDNLVAPGFAYDILPVERVEDSRIVVAGKVLNTGPHTRSLFTHAQDVMVSVATIGPMLEARVRDLQQAGELLESYFLDCAGVLALYQAGEAGARIMEQEAASRGWGVSARVGPGDLDGWPVEDQENLCSLVDLASVGVFLKSHVLLPFKSATALIAMGPGYARSLVGTVCHLCKRRSHCLLFRLKNTGHAS